MGAAASMKLLTDYKPEGFIFLPKFRKDVYLCVFIRENQSENTVHAARNALCICQYVPRLYLTEVL